jgi:hypothetical protein
VATDDGSVAADDGSVAAGGGSAATLSVVMGSLFAAGIVEMRANSAAVVGGADTV